MKKKSLKAAVVIAVLFFFQAVFPVFAASGDPQVTTYDQLLAAIRETRNASEARIEAMVGQENVREAWATGKLIDGHVLQHQERAKYGEQVIVRLANDLGTSPTELKYMLQFYRTYPIRPPADQLSWAHYRELLSINDPEEREEVVKEAAEEDWTRERVRKEVKARKEKKVVAKGGQAPFLGSNGSQTPLETIEPGPLDTHPIVRLNDSLKIDLGFGIYRDLVSDTEKLKEGDIVTSVKTSDGTYKLQKNKSRGASPESLFTYRAQVVSVVDGDTFHALIELGFGMSLAQRVRLRRIDAPEILSAEGKEAKVLLEEILARDQGRVILQSLELDQYGRPLADVWVEGKSIDQELLDQGLAVRMHD